MSTRKELFSGVAYTAIAKYMGIVVSLAITMVLSRLLPVEDFGVVAIATVIIAFFNIFCDLGMSPAIVQNQSLEKKDLSGIFTFTICQGLFLSVAFYLISPAISTFYESERLLYICRILSVNILFTSLNIVPNAIFFKKKEFKYIAVRNFVVQFIGGALAITSALNGFGIYALLVNPLFTSIAIFIVGIVRYPQGFSFNIMFGAMRKILSFSGYQFLFNVINFFSRNLDKLFIGKYLGETSLGYYEKSYRLMMLPLENISFIINPVMLPIFSDYQNDMSKMSHAYNKVIRFLAFLGFSLSAFLYFSSEELIYLLFGQQWGASIPAFRILSISVGIQIIMSTAGAIFQAAGTTRILFYNGLITSALNVAGIDRKSVV